MNEVEKCHRCSSSVLELVARNGERKREEREKEGERKKEREKTKEQIVLFLIKRENENDEERRFPLRCILQVNS